MTAFVITSMVLMFMTLLLNVLKLGDLIDSSDEEWFPVVRIFFMIGLLIWGFCLLF